MSPRHVIVIGGGLAGLTAAAELARARVAVTVFEGSSRFGGRAGSTLREGTIRNLGPHALALQGPGTQILRHLGIELPGARPALHRAKLLVDGRIVAAPDPRVPGVLRSLAALVRLNVAARASEPDGTVDDWLAATIPHAPSRRLLAPVVRLATYADAFEEQAADVVSEALRAGGVRYLDGGWIALVARLRRAAAAAGARLVAGRPAVAVQRDEGWVVTTGDGQRHAASEVVVAAGGPADAAALVRDEAATSTLQRWQDRAVPSRMATLDVALARRPPGPPLVLGVDDPLYLSVPSDRSLVAPPGGAIVQVARFLPLGGRAGEGTRDELESLLDRALEGWREALLHARYLPGLVVTHDGAPAAAGGRRARPGPEVPGADGLYVAGDWVGQAGTLAQTSIVSGAIAARRITSRTPDPALQQTGRS